MYGEMVVKCSYIVWRGRDNINMFTHPDKLRSNCTTVQYAVAWSMLKECTSICCNAHVLIKIIFRVTKILQIHVW